MTIFWISIAPERRSTMTQGQARKELERAQLVLAGTQGIQVRAFNFRSVVVSVPPKLRRSDVWDLVGPEFEVSAPMSEPGC